MRGGLIALVFAGFLLGAASGFCPGYLYGRNNTRSYPSPTPTPSIIIPSPIKSPKGTGLEDKYTEYILIRQPDGKYKPLSEILCEDIDKIRELYTELEEQCKRGTTIAKETIAEVVRKLIKKEYDKLLEKAKPKR